MKVFRMNDCDWWLAESLEAAKADYIATTGDESCLDEHDPPRELTDAELDGLTFTDDDEEGDGKVRRTFREELQRRIAAGVNAPEMFASTEY